MKKSILAIGLVALSLSAFAQGTFNGKNTSTSPVLGADGLKLSKVTGRVEILVGGTVLSTAKNTFAADGIFSLGVIDHQRRWWRHRLGDGPRLGLRRGCDL